MMLNYLYAFLHNRAAEVAPSQPKSLTLPESLVGASRKLLHTLLTVSYTHLTLPTKA